MNNIYMIGTTHFDPVWLWKWDEAMASVRSTFRSALDRMKEDSDFRYSFATPPVFEWIKETDYPMFEEICQRVREGRWDICEGWWVQPDCFSASGESYARHSLYGQRYNKETFGRYSECLFNVDSFGHNSAIPQIMKKSHIRYYCFCRPEARHVKLTSPYFTWIGNDGSAVKAFRTGELSESYSKNMPASIRDAEENIKNADCDEMMLYGVTNHGGAPTRKAISDIHELNESYNGNLRFSSVSGYFEAQDEPDSQYKGELITGDFGPYTDNHLVKKRNRTAEYSVLNAEKASVIAEKTVCKPVPKDKLTECWRDVMFNQFHDILGGACIRDAYTDIYNAQGRAIKTADEITHYALQSITRNIKMPGKNPDNPWNIVVWNLNDSDYGGYIEAEVQWLHEFPAYSGGLMLEDAENNRYDCQIIPEKSVINGFRTRFVFKADIPSFGYNTFRLVKTCDEAKIIVNEDFTSLSFRYLDVFFDKKTGLPERIVNKESGEVYEHIIKPCVFRDDGDTWCFNINGYGEKLDDFVLKDIKVIESGIHRTKVKTSLSFADSLLDLYWTFYEDEKYFDVGYVVSWNEKHAVLKLFVETAYEELTASAPFSAEKRGDTDCDVPMGEWITLSDGKNAVSVIADSIFSYNKRRGSVGLSVLRSCIYGDLRISELKDYDYSYMEQGICEGSIRIMFHSDDETGKITKSACAFNNPPVVICEANHDGILPPLDSKIKIDSENVMITAVKKCEDDDSTIIRLYETSGRAETTVLHCFRNSCGLAFKPFEIKTLKTDGENVSEVFITED